MYFVLQGAVKILGLMQEILPPLGQLNSQLASIANSHSPSLPPPLETPSPETSDVPSPDLLPVEPGLLCHSFDMTPSLEQNTTSNHYAIVESDHPYKPASVANYKVSTLLCGNVF